MTDLPSENLKTKQALYAHVGQKNWNTSSLGTSDGTVDAARKLELLQAAHCHDLQHLGGRDGICAALKATGYNWPNLKLDATFFCFRCEDLLIFFLALR